MEVELKEAWANLHDYVIQLEKEDTWRQADDPALGIKQRDELAFKFNMEAPFRLTDETVLWAIDSVTNGLNIPWANKLQMDEGYPDCLAMYNTLTDGSYMLSDLLGMELPQPPSLLDTFMVKGSITLVHAAAGVGKTPFAMMLCNAMLAPMGFIGWEAGNQAANKVLYMDGELPLWLLKQRALSIFDSQNISKVQLFNAASWYAKGNLGLDLSLQAVQDNLSQYIADAEADVVVLDNRSNFFHGDENDNNEAHALNRFLIKLRETGKTIIINHHQGKGGGFRGASAIVDPVDNVIGLDRVEDTTDEIDIKFEKARFGWPHQSYLRARLLSKGDNFWFKKEENTNDE